MLHHMSGAQIANSPKVPHKRCDESAELQSTTTAPRGSCAATKASVTWCSARIDAKSGSVKTGTLWLTKNERCSRF